MIVILLFDGLCKWLFFVLWWEQWLNHQFSPSNCRDLLSWWWN